MAEAMQFDLVSPERRLASLPATEVHIPGAAGDLSAMPGHEPVITNLRPGLLRAVTSEGVKSYVVTGGFAEISAEGVIVLAERAIPYDEATGTILDEILAAARSLAEAAAGNERDAAEKTVAAVSALRDAVIARHH